MKKLIKDIIDFFIIKGVSVRINNINLKLLFSWRRYFPSKYEIENFSFFENCKFENPVILDLGAHIGLFSILMAKQCNGNAKIYSFEGSPETFKILEKHISINNFNGIINPINQVISDQKGEINFFVSSSKGDNANSISNYKENERKLSSIRINSTSIDSFVKEHNLNKLDFFKIDVEGAECKVIRGGKNSIIKFKPKMLLSIHPKAIFQLNDNLHDEFDFLKGLGYKIYFNGILINSYSDIAGETELFDLHLI